MWGNESDLYTDGNKQMHDFMDKINMSMEKYVGFTSIFIDNDCFYSAY